MMRTKKRLRASIIGVAAIVLLFLFSVTADKTGSAERVAPRRISVPNSIAGQLLVVEGRFVVFPNFISYDIWGSMVFLSDLNSLSLVLVYFPPIRPPYAEEYNTLKHFLEERKNELPEYHYALMIIPLPLTTEGYKTIEKIPPDPSVRIYVIADQGLREKFFSVLGLNRNTVPSALLLLKDGVFSADAWVDVEFAKQQIPRFW